MRVLRQLSFALTQLVITLPLMVAVESVADSKPRITGVKLFDGTAESTAPSIDVLQSSCGESSEKFEDSRALLTINNPSASALRVISARFAILGGTTVRSSRVRFFGALEIPPKSAATAVQTLFLSAREGRKYLPGKTSALESVGARNVSVEVRARLNGALITLRGRSIVSLGDLDRCSG